jgi:DNA-directed RNA polymerase specialized sigma24 family protein
VRLSWGTFEGETVANLVGNIPDDFVPQNCTVLYDTYSPFVTRLVTRYNRVQANFEDLLQHVWMKLVEVNVIQKYHDSSSLPKKMTAIQACDYLGISWQSWERAIHCYPIGEDRHLGHIRSVSKGTKAKVLRRDQGVCHCCGKNMEDFAKVFKMYKEDPLRAKGFKKILSALSLSANQKTFWYAVKKDAPFKKGLGVVDRYETLCFLCLRTNSPPVVRSKSEWAPTPVEGTWSSKSALYTRETVERFRLERELRGKHKDSCPKRVKSKPFFKLYLARAVHNIYANWCRTRSRRYKEHFPGNDPETGRSWEDTLVSTAATQDTLAELYEAVSILIDSGSDGITRTHEEVIILLAKGCSPEEIVVRLGLPQRGLKTLLPET